MFSLNIELLGWATGSLLFAGAALFFLRFSLSDWWMLSTIAIVFTAYFFFYFSGGPDFGARYWFVMLLPLIALSARGLFYLEQRLGPEGWRVLPSAGVVCLIVVINYFPWRATDKYWHYLNMRPDVREFAQARGLGKSLVVIRGQRHPDYASAASYNPLKWDAPAPVYAWDNNDSAKEILRFYPGRPIWILEGPSITGDGFRLVADPNQSPGVLNAGDTKNGVLKTDNK
ncbi:MAG: hypothetical protein WKF37_22365 [Bryobacteraceae bacterium]